MHKPKALYFENCIYTIENQSLIHELFDVTTLKHPNLIPSAADGLGDIDVLFAPLGTLFNHCNLYLFPGLKCIVSNTTSIPHIDIQYCSLNNIEISALHNESEFLAEITSTAEHAVGLILACQRRVHSAHKDVLSGNWDRTPWGAPRMLSRSTIGIIGYGRLGRKVSLIAKSLGMRTLWYDPYLPPASNDDGRMNTLHDLSRCSNVLSIHASQLEEQKPIVTQQIIEAMPANSIIVNTARGYMLDTQALLAALESKHIWAAALDTLDGEFLPNFHDNLNDHPLVNYARTHDNLLLTPHIGGSTYDSWHLTQKKVITKCLSYINNSLS